MTTGIYKITNPKGKVYIGQSINIPMRFSSYRKMRSNSTGPKLLHSIRKYGYANHTFEILECCEPSKLNDREVYWKLHFNSVKEGLNCELYDNSTGPKSEATKAKISQTLKGRFKGRGAKSVLQYSDSGILIKTWLSSSEASKQLGYQGSAISECCSGKRKTYKGYIWKFE